MNPSNTYSPGLISVDQFKQAGQDQQPIQQIVQPQQQPQHSGNWFTHLLPTAGGILGAVLAPETGGLSLLASAGLAGLGTAAGKAAENIGEGQGVGNGVVGAGIGGGVGGLLGGIGGKILGSTAGTVAGEETAGTGIAGALKKRAVNLTSAAEDAATQRSAVAAEQATRNNYGIADKLKGGDHLALGTNQKFLNGMGYDATDPYQMAKAAEVGYHPSDLSYNGIYNEALQGAKPVDMSGFGNDVYKTMQQTGTTDLSTSPLGKALQDFHTKTGNLYGSDGIGITLPKDMNAVDVRKLQQAVGREMGNQQTLINNAANLGQTNINAESAHSTLSDLYDQLGSKVKTPEVDQAIASRTLTPEERDALVNKFGPKLGNHAADTIDNAQNADALLAPMRQTTQMGKAGEIGIDNIENKTGSTNSIARAKADTNGDGVVTAADQSIPAGAISSIANAPGGTLGKAVALGKHAVDNPKILSVLSRIGDMGSKLLPTAGVVAGTAAGMGADPVASVGSIGAVGNGGIMGGAMQGTGESPMNQLYRTLLSHIQASGGIGPNDGAIASALQSLAPEVQKNNLLATQMGGMPSLYANAGGAQGLGGIMSHISGLIPGTAAHTYQAQQAAIAHQLGIDPAMLPGLMQNGPTSGISQGILGNLHGQLAY